MKKYLFISLLIINLVLTAGCERAGETLAELKNDFQQEVTAPTPKQEDMLTKTDEVQQPEIPEMDDLTIEETYEPVQTSGIPQTVGGAEVEVSLYFAAADGENVVETKKVIPKVEGLARATIESLLAGPETGSGLKASVPEGTKLLDINIKAEQKLCIVDFSRELIDEMESSGINKKVIVESITNTLCQFPSIEKVEFRIEGQPISLTS